MIFDLCFCVFSFSSLSSVDSGHLTARDRPKGRIKVCNKKIKGESPSLWRMQWRMSKPELESAGCQWPINMEVVGFGVSIEMVPSLAFSRHKFASMEAVAS